MSDLSHPTWLRQFLNSEPVWAQIYLLLRAGHVQEAYELARQNDAAIARADKFFVGFFKAWIDSPTNT